jgi:hypothetical protein
MNRQLTVPDVNAASSKALKTLGIMQSSTESANEMRKRSIIGPTPTASDQPPPMPLASKRRSSLEKVNQKALKMLKTPSRSPLHTQDSTVGSITTASCAGFITQSLAFRSKKRFFMLTPTRLLYFKSNTVTSKLLGSMEIDSRTIITFPKGGIVMQLTRKNETGKSYVLTLVFADRVSMKGWEMGIESSIHMQQRAFGPNVVDMNKELLNALDHLEVELNT